MFIRVRTPHVPIARLPSRSRGKRRIRSVGVCDPGESSFGRHSPKPDRGSPCANAGNPPAVRGRDHLTAAIVEDVFSGDDNTNTTTEESDFVTDGNRPVQNHPRERDFVTNENGPDMNKHTTDDGVDATRSRRKASSNHPGRGRAVSGQVRDASFTTPARSWRTSPEDLVRRDPVFRRRVSDSTATTLSRPRNVGAQQWPKPPVDLTVPVGVAVRG